MIFEIDWRAEQSVHVESLLKSVCLFLHVREELVDLGEHIRQALSVNERRVGDVVDDLVSSLLVKLLGSL